MSAQLDHELRAILAEGIRSRLFPGAAYAVLRKGRWVAGGALGRLSPHSRFPVTPDTLWDMASLTKPMATALSVLKLCETGAVDLHQPVATYFADAPDTPASRSTVFQYLTHTSGLPAWNNLAGEPLTRQEKRNRILEMPLRGRPGEHYEYSCLGYIVLGELVSTVSGCPLDRLTRETIYEPLKMRDTGYRPPPGKRTLAAPTEKCAWRRRRVRGQVHDENAYSLGGVSGNAGLFSTLRDVQRFVTALCTNRRPDGSPLLRDNVYRYYVGEQVRLNDAGQTCGWFACPTPKLPVPDGLGSNTIGHTGFTGTSVMVDITSQSGAVLLTNRVYYGRQYEPFGECRRQYYRAVKQYLYP